MFLSPVAGCSLVHCIPFPQKVRALMIPICAIELNVCRAYLAQIKEQYPDPTYESDKLLLILGIYEWQLKRLRSKPGCHL